MKTLKELVDIQDQYGFSDIQIIRFFFEKNDMEEEGIDLMHNLMKTKIDKMKQREYVVRAWTSYIPSLPLYKKYDLETANKLHILELDYISHGKQLSDARMAWAKENVPNIELPQPYFNPLLDYLREHGICFKGDDRYESN